MVILHVACIRNTLYSGVDIAVPQHVRAQQDAGETVAFVNVVNVETEGIQKQFFYGKNFSICKLPVPFCAPDIIVFHEVYRPAFLKLYKPLKAAGIPYIIVPHGCLTRKAQRKKWWKKIAANLLLFNAFVKGAAAIQFLSGQELENSTKHRRAFIGTNGVFMPDKKKERFHTSEVKVVYIGRTEVRIKGLDLMLQAVMLLGEKLRERHVRLCLYGPDRDNNHAEVRRLMQQCQVEDLVELHEEIDGSEKEAELLSADIFIQTSRSEGMSMGILEALSYGVPCLVTRGTNLGEIIEQYDAGWVAETNAESIAETLLKALDERERWEEKSRNAVRLVEENFLWGKVVRATIDEYRRIIGKNKSKKEG